MPEVLAKLKRSMLARCGSLFAAALMLQMNDSSAAGASACAGIGCFGAIIFFVILICINIAILVWVQKDAKARGMDNPMLWMVLVLFTGVIGLIIYFLSRPKGEIIACPSCGQKRMVGLAKCPSCGNP
jgi:ABC-type Fe3+-siderophore transport system permease subunit